MAIHVTKIIIKSAQDASELEDAILNSQFSADEVIAVHL